ncbi:MAG: Gfo/Idh/MocA family protein [Anaerolineae bacterium]
MADRPVAVGVVGLGRAGWDIHVRTLQSPVIAGKFRLAAVTDPIEGRMAEAAELTGCRTHRNLEALCADPEVELVVVATPSHLHAEHSVDAMRAGKHVLCEKPMAISLAEADQMLEVQRQTGRVLTFDQEMRYEPNFLKVQEVLASGKLGRVFLICIAYHRFSRRWDWQTLKAFGGGMLNNWATHLVDMGLLLFGEGEPEVFSVLENTPLYCGGDAEDTVKVMLRGEGKPTVDVEITYGCAYPQDRWLVLGTQGTLTGSATSLRWKYIDPELLPPRQVSAEPTPDRSYNREEITWYEESWECPRNVPDGYEKLYLDLYATLRQGAPLAITPESVRRQIAVLEECRRQSPLYNPTR